ncbi:NAD+ synthetase, partial [gut metagenome]
AQNLAQALGANYASISIGQSCQHTLDQLEHTPITAYADNSAFTLSVNQLGRENIQARDRGARIIAAAAAAFGGAFSCNSNKAEMSIGYATFYGDICGALAMIGDLWKRHVYALGRYLNEEVYQRQVIPN